MYLSLQITSVVFGSGQNSWKPCPYWLKTAKFATSSEDWPISEKIQPWLLYYFFNTWVNSQFPSLTEQSSSENLKRYFKAVTEDPAHNFGACREGNASNSYIFQEPAVPSAIHISLYKKPLLHSLRNLVEPAWHMGSIPVPLLAPKW